MAKRGKDGFDDIDLDNLDDWDDFGEPPRQDDKKRNPILNTLRTARKSALSTIWPEGKRDQVILKGMPKPATDAYEGYQSAAAAAKDIYAHTKGELEKTERTLKQQARQLGPTMRKYLPDAVTKRIDKWSKSDELQYSQYDPNQALMDRELNEVFAGNDVPNSPEEQRTMQQQMTEDKLRDAVKDMKADAMHQTLIGMAKDVNLLTGLNRGVFLNIERKKLELQYRTLFALQDLSKLKQTEFDRNTPALEAIVKNTALPDYAKEDFSEVRWANVKRQAAEWMNPLKYAEGFMEMIRENTKKKISGAFGEGRGLLESFLSMGVEDDFGMEDSSSLSADKRKTNARGKAVGWGSGFLAKKLLGPQIEKLQKYTREQMEKNPEVMKRLQKGSYTFQNLSSLSNSAIAGETDGPLADLFRALNELGIITPHGREKAFLDERNGETLSRSAKFDRKAYLSLVEVIPAWLSEINKSIRRGYGEHADQEYDITSRGFVDRKVVGNRIRKAVANDDQRLRLQKSINSTVDFVDKGKVLSAKDRQHLADYIESRASQGRAFDVESILKDPTHLSRHMPTSAAERIQAALQSHSDSLTGGSGELSNNIAHKIATVQSSISQRQALIDEAVNIYGERALRDAGIFNYDAKSDTFGVDKDLSDPYTMFNDLAMGKTRSGRALTRDQEIARKLQNGSALGDYLRRMNQGASGGVDDTSLPPALRGGGKGRGMSPRQLAAVLYGETSTNFVELLSQRNQQEPSQLGSQDRVVDAIRESNNATLIQQILDHVKSMDEEGILLASLSGGSDAGGDEEMGPPKPGGRKGKRRRIIIGEDGLMRRWGGVLFDTIGGAGRLARKGVKGAWDKLNGFGSWARGKISGMGGGEGPGLFSKLTGLISGTAKDAFDSVAAFGKGVLGIRDIYDEHGNVVLQGSRLAAGEYYQVSSGQGGKLKQLKSLDDIRLGRDIVDESGNLILSAADLAKAGKLRYYKGGRVQALTEVLAGKVGMGFNKVIKLPKKFLDFLSPKAGSVVTKIKDWLNEIPEGEEKSRLSKAFSRITSLPGKAWNFAKTGVDKLKDLITDNPLTRWWQGRGDGGKGGFSLFSGSTGRKTNHILIRIYKLLNKRLAGEPEDEGWTEQMERNVGGGSKIGEGAARLLRRAKVMGRRRFGGRWGRMKAAFGRGRSRLGEWFDGFRNRAGNVADSFRDARHDIGTRYEVERRLAGRDDDVSDFYREHLYQRGAFSGRKVAGAAKDDMETVRDAAGRVVNKGKNAAKSVGAKLFERLDRMVGLQEMSWFNTMRESVAQAGGSDGLLRTMFAKFGRRNKPGEGDEKRDYFQFFRRWRDKREEKKKKATGSKSKVGGLMDMLKGLPLIGPLVSILGTVGSILGTVAKWGIFKPGKLLGKAAWQVGKFAVTRLAAPALSAVATAGSAVVAAVGWPAILIGGAIAAVGYAAYKIATTTYTKYLDKMRLAQYGFRDYDKWSSDDGAKARYLEDALHEYVSYNEKGQATIRGLGAKDVQKLAEGFGVNVEEKGEMLAFQAFMLQRFMPIYLRWITALKSLDNDVQLKDLGDSSKVSKADMQAIFAKVKMNKDAKEFTALTDPRKVNQGFFSKAWDFVTFTSPDLLDADEVMDVQTEVERSIKFRVDDATAKRKGMLQAVEGIKSAGVAEAAQKLTQLDDERNKNVAKAQGWEDGTEQVQIQVDYNGILDQKDINALESVRWKSYGLVSIDTTARTMMSTFEKNVIKDIDVKTSSYKGDWKKAIAIIAPDAIGTPKEDRMKLWFFSRFLPVFMTYLVGVKRYLPTGDPLNLKLTGGYLYELGLMMRGAYTLKGGVRQSVWEIAVNPLGGEANTDPNTVKEELETLRVLSKEADLAVRNMLKETQSAGKRAKWQRRDKNVSFLQTEGGDDDPNISSGDTLSAEGQRASGYIATPGSSGVPNDLGQTVDMVGGVGNYAKMTTGQSSINLTEVQDGDYKSFAQKYPLESLGRRGAMNTPKIKEMIIDAAKMMGVPPAVALGMAKAESGFNYLAKNPYASASGLFQFVNGTWKGMMDKYARKFGIPRVGQQDPWANTILGLQFIRDNIQQAQRDLGGKAPPPAVAYLYHFLGPGGGKMFLNAWMKNPNAPASSAPGITRAILTGNKNVFYDGQGRIRSIDGVIQELNRRIGAVSANQMAANPNQTDDMKANLSPTGATNPAQAMGAGAANDPSLSPTDNLPADNAARRDDALTQKGAMAAQDAAATAAGNAGPAAPSPNGSSGGGGSDIDTTADSVAAQAAADGLSPTDVAKVKAGAQAQVNATTKAAAPVTSDATASTPTLNGEPIDAQQLKVLIQSRDYLKEIRDLIKANPRAANQSPGGNAGQQAGVAPPGSASRRQDITQPTPSLNVSRKAS
ncbi:putative tail fiber protein [Salmonella phage SPAsTU]|nr:putative tail fiber protein [Salmonella phage SPAsTU]